MTKFSWLRAIDLSHTRVVVPQAKKQPFPLISQQSRHFAFGRRFGQPQDGSWQNRKMSCPQQIVRWWHPTINLRLKYMRLKKSLFIPLETYEHTCHPYSRLPNLAPFSGDLLPHFVEWRVIGPRTSRSGTCEWWEVQWESNLQRVEPCFVWVHLAHYDNGWEFCCMHQRLIVLCHLARCRYGGVGFENEVAKL